MFIKLYRKLNRVAAMAVMLSFLFPVMGQASADVLGGSVIQATPFDRQLMRAGGFQTHFSVLTGSLRSSDDLFLLARSMRYTPDPEGQDTWQTPQETQARWAGDCEDKALWLFANLKQNGYTNVRLVVGRNRSIDRGLHVWVTMADDHGDVFILDPTTQKRIWKAADFEDGYYKALYSFDGMNRYRHDS